ncbi:MAG: branched-chain amino acid ABC transporter permease [Hyphomicrobiales bacterium]|nr:branched-chain amino acid ABC transporter permease [Hyphomicrobiales bacterium]
MLDAAQPATPVSAPSGAARSEQIAFAIMLALLVLAPMAVYPFFMMTALCFALFACAFNLLVGYVGLLAFGHAMFLGIGGYVSAHMAKVGNIEIGPLHVNFGPLSPELAILCGVGAAGLLGLVTGALAIRRQGIYFSMITLALSQMIYFFCLQAPFTHGEDGIQAVPQGKMFGFIDLSNQNTLYYVVVAIFILSFLAIHRIVNSPFGDILKAIRENEPRAISLGYKVDQYKLTAFILSAMLAGLAGATKAIVAQNASLTDVHWSMSGEVILMTLVGGMGTIFGPAVGAIIIIAMQNYLAGFGQWVTVIQGVIFVACVLAFRRGIIGEIANRLKISL